MLSFDEFRAVQRRENANKTDKNKDPKDNKAVGSGIDSKSKLKEFNEFDDFLKSKTNKEKENDENKKNNSKLNNNYVSKVTNAIGEFLELHQMQAFYILLVILDTFSCLAELNLLQNNNNLAKIIPLLGQPQLLKIFQTFSIFTRLFFISEKTRIFA